MTTGPSIPRARRWRVLLVAASCLALAPCAKAEELLPAGLTVRTERVVLTGARTAVDLYLPQGVDRAPVVVVAHGFTRGRGNMAGWGRLLATNGFIAAVLDQLAWADHPRNARAIAELLATVQTGSLVRQPAPAARGALIGFSMGGLTTLLAAAGRTNVACWVGLDPVSDGLPAESAAAALRIPAVVLRAKPGACNADGNARRIIAALPGPRLALQVNAATHGDAEDPTDWLAELACGRTDPARRTVFEQYALAALRAVFFRDPSAEAVLRAAARDPRVSGVEARELDRFAVGSTE